MTARFENNTLTLDCKYDLNSSSVYDLIDKIKNPGEDIIKKVCVKYAPFLKEDFKDFLDAINNNQLIEKLELNNIRIGFRYDEYDSEYYKFGLYKNDIEILCERLKNNKHLRKLTLVDFYIKTKNAKLLKMLFQDNKTIQYLSIYSSKVSKKTNQILFDFLRNNFFCKLKLCNNQTYKKGSGYYGYSYSSSGDYLENFLDYNDIDISNLFI